MKDSALTDPMLVPELGAGDPPAPPSCEWAVLAVRPALQPLWALASWYASVMVVHAASTPAHTWWTALVVCAIVGTALNANAYSAAAPGTAAVQWATHNPCTVARFFLIPFCVSSYSSVVASAGDTLFVSVFPRDRNTLVAATCASVGAALLVAAVYSLLARGKTCRGSFSTVP